MLEITTQIENVVGVMKSNEEAALKGLEREHGMRDVAWARAQIGVTCLTELREMGRLV